MLKPKQKRNEKQYENNNNKKSKRDFKVQFQTLRRKQKRTNKINIMNTIFFLYF